MKEIFPALLLSSCRADVTDEQYFGFVFLYKNFSRIFTLGDDNGAKFYLRSLSKPVQASVMADFNLQRELDLSDEEIAVCCASHSGTKRHCDLVLSILKKAGLDESYLKCPSAVPLDMRDFDGTKRPLYHNCSAKHALMLALCVKNGWDLTDYLEINHPLQKIIKEKHLVMSGARDIEISLDGCGAPVFALCADNIAKMFFNLFNDRKYRFLRNAMVENPYIAGGKDRPDSEIMELGQGNLVSKVGAGGFVLVYNIKEDMILIVKMSQNNNLPRRIVTLNALLKLGWIKSNPAPSEYFNECGKKVGDYICNFSFL